MVVKISISTCVVSLFLISAHGVTLRDGYLVNTDSTVTDTVTEKSVLELPCKSYLSNYKLKEEKGKISIVVNLPENPDKCLYWFQGSNFQTSQTFYRLTFNNKGQKVDVKYSLNSKEFKTNIPTTPNYEFVTLAKDFTITWDRSSVSDAQISFEYEELLRDVDNVEVFQESEKTVTLDDVGGFRTNSIHSFYIIGDNEKQNHSLDIVLDKLVLDEEAGDYFTIGQSKGNESMFSSSLSLMLFSSISKPVKVIVSGKDAFVSMSTVFSRGVDSNGRKVDFKLSYNMSGLNVIKTTPKPVVVIDKSEAELQAVSLCFYQVRDPEWTCEKFLSKTYLDLFQNAVAELAQYYVDDQKIKLPTSGGIRLEQVKVECYFTKKGKYNDSREDNFITVGITNPLDEEKPLLSYQQLKSFFKISEEDLYKMLKKEYKVKECESYPNYWYWYWGSIAIFVMCILLLMIIWYWSNVIVKKENKQILPQSTPYGVENQVKTLEGLEMEEKSMNLDSVNRKDDYDQETKLTATGFATALQRNKTRLDSTRSNDSDSETTIPLHHQQEPINQLFDPSKQHLALPSLPQSERSFGEDSNSGIYDNIGLDVTTLDKNIEVVDSKGQRSYTDSSEDFTSL